MDKKKITMSYQINERKRTKENTKLICYSMLQSFAIRLPTNGSGSIVITDILAVLNIVLRE